MGGIWYDGAARVIKILAVPPLSLDAAVPAARLARFLDKPRSAVKSGTAFS